MSKQQLSRSVISRIPSIQYWEKLNPELTISEYPFLRDPLDINAESLDQVQYVSQMKREGYIKLDGVLPGERMELLARAITTLVEEGFPPVMCYVYDEFWQIFRDISPVISPIFGERYRLSINRWAWYIPASEEVAGFAPHRDMTNCPLPVMGSDGLPLIATVWIPLSDVSASNACMHVLPMNHDPHLPDDKTKTTIPHDKIQCIRALPAKAGSVMSWNPNVLHWGSRGSPWASMPRISIATYLIRSEATAFSGISTDISRPLTFDFRLGIVAKALINYDEESLVEERYSIDLITLLKKYELCEPDEWRFPQYAED